MHWEQRFVVLQIVMGNAHWTLPHGTSILLVDCSFSVKCAVLDKILY